jgi:hypothetical protein
MAKPLSAIWLVALVAVFAIFAFSMHQDGPEPFALPVQTSAVPVVPSTAVQGATIRVFVENFPTLVPEPTRGVWQTPTSAVPACPGKNHELCVVPAPVLIVPTMTIVSCNAESIATFVPGEICRWSDVTSTPVPNTGGLWK